MTRYICLLRSINVSGRNLIKIEDLKNAFLELDFKGVKSNLQTGNFIFNTEEMDNEVLKIMIVDKIKSKNNIIITPLLFTENEFLQITSCITHKKLSDFQSKSAYITFFDQSVPNIDSSIFEQKKGEDESYIVSEHAFFLYSPSGYGKSKLNNNFIEKKLCISATTRNWNTISKLISLISTE